MMLRNSLRTLLSRLRIILWMMLRNSSKDTSEHLYEWRLNQEEVGRGVEKNEEDFEETTEEIEEVEQLMR